MANQLKAHKIKVLTKPTAGLINLVPGRCLKVGLVHTKDLGRDANSIVVSTGLPQPFETEQDARSVACVFGLFKPVVAAFALNLVSKTGTPLEFEPPLSDEAMKVARILSVGGAARIQKEFLNEGVVESHYNLEFICDPFPDFFKGHIDVLESAELGNLHLSALHIAPLYANAKYGPVGFVHDVETDMLFIVPCSRGQFAFSRPRDRLTIHVIGARMWNNGSLLIKNDEDKVDVRNDWVLKSAKSFIEAGLPSFINYRKGNALACVEPATAMALVKFANPPADESDSDDEEEKGEIVDVDQPGVSTLPVAKTPQLPAPVNDARREILLANKPSANLAKRRGGPTDNVQEKIQRLKLDAKPSAAVSSFF